MPPIPKILECADHKLAYVEYGDLLGFPVVYCHGTPGSAVEGEFIQTTARRLGLRIIAVDRPGYGGTDPAPSLGYAGWAQIMLQLMTRLGIERYAVLGLSGGGPNALALAAADTGRVVGLSLVCPLGAFTAPELAHAANPFATWLLRQAHHQPRWFDRLLLRPVAAFARKQPRLAVACMRLYNGRADRACLGRAAVAELLAHNLRRAFQQSSAGVARDFWVMQNPWDFSLAPITQPVQLWHGTADILLKPAHSQWIKSQLPHAELQLIPGAGHFSLPIEHHAAILQALALHC